jgi:hypothetical protein
LQIYSRINRQSLREDPIDATTNPPWSFVTPKDVAEPTPGEQAMRRNFEQESNGCTATQPL